MITVKLTEKERDAVESMTEFWWGAGDTFQTSTHGKFRAKDMENLVKKLGYVV
jgi:GH24 family phage-related lysozyme (muramidase)